MEVVLKKIRMYCDKRARIHTDRKTGKMEIRYSVWCRHTRTKKLSSMDEAQAFHLMNDLYGG